MSFNSMADNWKNNQSVYQTHDINTFPINSLSQQFYTINCIITKNSYSYFRTKKILLQIELCIIVTINVHAVNNCQKSMKFLK